MHALRCYVTCVRPSHYAFCKHKNKTIRLVPKWILVPGAMVYCYPIVFAPLVRWVANAEKAYKILFMYNIERQSMDH